MAAKRIRLSPSPTPEYFGDCPCPLLIELVCTLFSRLASLNNNIANQNMTRFHSTIVPNISLKLYLERIAKYCVVEKSALILSVIYLERMCVKSPHFAFNQLTSHRFIITAVTVASKTLSDVYCTNPYFAKVGGITCQELNLLELEFCKSVDWDLSINEPLMQRYYMQLLATWTEHERLNRQVDSKVLNIQSGDSVD